jgi:hypothetical protein
LGTVLGITLGTVRIGFHQGLTGFGGDAEAVEALVCKTSLSGFESHRYLHFLCILEVHGAFDKREF